MKGWHWLLAAAAVGILVAEQVLTGRPGQPGRYLMYYYALEVAYFFVLLALGTAIGGMMRRRLLARQDKAEYVKSVRTYRLLALLFVLASGMYLLTAWIPSWIGRHIIFFGGYYYGLSRIHPRDE